MILVIDSAAALRACSSTSARRSLVEHELLGPPLLWSEVTSAIHEAVWRREIDAVGAGRLRGTFRELSVARRAPASLHDSAWEIADELGLAKTYDAEFLALARIEGCKVLTTDARLRRSADRTGLVMDPSEL